jgi:hypothetical protein
METGISVDKRRGLPNCYRSTIRPRIGLMGVENEGPSDQDTQLVRAAIRKALASHRDKVKGTSEEKDIDDAMKWFERIDAEEEIAPT